MSVAVSVEVWGVLAGLYLFVLLAGFYFLQAFGWASRLNQLIGKRTEKIVQEIKEEEQKTKETLAEIEKRMRLIVETANDAFVGMDVKGFITDWNRQAEIIFGWPRTEAIGRPLADTIIPPKLREAHKKGLHHFLMTGEGPVLNKRIEITALHRDGHEFPVELTVCPVRLGGTLSFNAFIHDITERKQAQERLNQKVQELEEANVQLEELDHLKTEFVNTVNHELRTPLTSIKEGINLVLDGSSGPIATEQVRFLQIAKNNIDRLHRMINNLLDISKIEAGRMELYRNRFELPLLLEEAVATHRLEAKEKGIQLSFETVPDVLPVEVDHDRFLQVLGNLVNNAIKFTPRGGKIRVAARPQNEHFVCIAVEDSGPGIEKEDQNKLFGKFQQIVDEKGRKTGGTGLGLAICKAIVEAHGG